MFDQTLPVLGLNIRSVYDSEFSASKPLIEHVILRIECVMRAGLILFIIADEAA